jgi:hypothetical protein
VDVDTRCPMCNGVDEDGGQVFLKCTKVNQIWRCISSFKNFDFIFCPRSCSNTECGGLGRGSPIFVSGLIASEIAERSG